MNPHSIQQNIIADLKSLGVSDSQSIQILAVGRVAQAALASEVQAMSARGASPDEVATYRADRGAQLDRWLALQCEAIRTRTILRDEVRRCLG